jgi:hypothetical protein
VKAVGGGAPGGDKMGMWKGARRPGRWGVRVLGLVVLAAVAAPRPGFAAAYTPDPDEYALLALANEARQMNGGLTPYLWNDELGEAALAHSVDMATHNCFQHESCNGQSAQSRIASYYPGAISIGENIGGGGTPRMMHDAWMMSPGHRANILGPYLEFGAGIAYDAENSSLATEDFAWRTVIPLDTYPTVPAGAVIPRVGYASDSREILVNYFFSGGAPKAVNALVGSSCVKLSKVSGSATNATYGTNRLFPDAGCVPVVFEVVRADGVRLRWPESGAIVVGTGTASLGCPAWTSNVPTQNCASGTSAPTPTPTPAPTPGAAGNQLDGVHAVLKPPKANTSTGQVQVQAVLPSIAGFDPSAGPLSIHLAYGRSGDWTASVPQMCGSRTCLKPNNRQTTYRWHSGSNSVGFLLGQNGRWKLHTSWRGQTLGTLSSGPVTGTLTAGGMTFDLSADGVLKPSSFLVAK